jgi:hypothetical protein
LPATLLQRLTEKDAQIVRGIAARAYAEAPLADCVWALKKLRIERELGEIQREIDRLQHDDATVHGNEIAALSFKKKDLKHLLGA